MSWPDLQGLGDPPLPIPLGDVLLLHPSVTEFQPPWPFHSWTGSSSLLSQGPPSSFIFTSYTSFSSLANFYSSFRSQLRRHFLQDASLTTWWDLTSLFHALRAPQIPPLHFTCTHETICIMTKWLSQLDYKIPWKLGPSLSNWLSYFQELAELSNGYLINICWINTWLPMQTKSLH